MPVSTIPTIKVDHQKCTVPFYCKKCLEACPTSVFHVHAVKVEKGRETNPQDKGAYMIDAPFRDKCTGCNDCLEVCPEDAITITFPGQEA